MLVKWWQRLVVYHWIKFAAAQTNLFEVQGDGDPVELSSVGDGRTLPPAIAAVDGEVDGMTLGGTRLVADATLDPVSGSTFDVFHQLTERLRFTLPARRVRRDVRVRRQVKHVWKPTFK